MKSAKLHCSSIPLSAGELGDVKFCPRCDAISVTVQSVTIRFETSAFADLAQLIAQAQRALVPRQASSLRVVDTELCH